MLLTRLEVLLIQNQKFVQLTKTNVEQVLLETHLCFFVRQVDRDQEKIAWRWETIQRNIFVIRKEAFLGIVELTIITLPSIKICKGVFCDLELVTKDQIK